MLMAPAPRAASWRWDESFLRFCMPWNGYNLGRHRLVENDAHEGAFSRPSTSTAFEVSARRSRTSPEEVTAASPISAVSSV